MKPSMAQVLMGSASAMATQVAPHLLGNGYAIGQASMAGLIMVLAAQEAERAVDTLVRERDALKALFGEAARADVSEGLAARLHEAAHAPLAPNLQITLLEAEVAPLKALLIELHVALEEEDAPWARALEAQVWDVLKLGADARLLYLPTM